MNLCEILFHFQIFDTIFDTEFFLKNYRFSTERNFFRLNL